MRASPRLLVASITNRCVPASAPLCPISPTRTGVDNRPGIVRQRATARRDIERWPVSLCPRSAGRAPVSSGPGNPASARRAHREPGLSRPRPPSPRRHRAPPCRPPARSRLVANAVRSKSDRVHRSGDDSKAGGLVGVNTAQIRASQAHGNVTAGQRAWAGGLVGWRVFNGVGSTTPERDFSIQSNGSDGDVGMPRFSAGLRGISDAADPARARWRPGNPASRPSLHPPRPHSRPFPHPHTRRARRCRRRSRSRRASNGVRS